MRALASLLAAAATATPSTRSAVPHMAVPASPPAHVAVVAVDALVDAEPAAARAAWSAARVLWPEAMEAARSYSDNPRAAGARRAWAGGEWAPLLGEGADGMPKWLAAKMRLLRPLVAAEHEAVLLARLCADEAGVSAAGARPLSVGEIVASWQDDELCQSLEARYGVSHRAIARQYDAVRDEWRAREPRAWLDSHAVYPGAESALAALLGASQLSEVYLATAEAEPALAHAALSRTGVAVDEGRMLSVCGGVADTLCEVRSRHRESEGDEIRISYVDARADALREVAADPRHFGSTSLYFARWGHSTPQASALASLMPRVRCLDAASQMSEAIAGIAAPN